MSKILTLTALLIGCQGCPKPVPIPAADAEYVDSEDGKKFDACGKACINIRLLGCPEGEPNDGGDSCEVTCRHSQTSGLTDLKPQCISAAKTVNELRACGTVKCKM